MQNFFYPPKFPYKNRAPRESKTQSSWTMGSAERGSQVPSTCQWAGMSRQWLGAHRQVIGREVSQRATCKPGTPIPHQRAGVRSQ